MKRIKTYLTIKYLSLVLLLIFSCKKDKKVPAEQYYGEAIELTREYFPMHGLFDFTSSPAVSPDGKYLVYRVAPEISTEKYGLWLVNLQNQTKNIFRKSASSPSWAPDSKRLCYTVAGNVFINTILGNSEVELTNEGSCYEPSWNPKKDIISYDHSTKGLHFINLITREINKVTDYTGGGSASWNSDGIDILGFKSNAPNSLFTIWDSENKSLFFLNPIRNSYSTNPTYSPNGKQLAFQSNNGIYIVNTDGSNVQQLLYNRVDKKVGEPYQAGDKLIGNICWHPDGEHLIYQQIEFKASLVSVLGLEGEGYSTLYKLNIDKALQTNKP